MKGFGKDILYVIMTVVITGLAQTIGITVFSGNGSIGISKPVKVGNVLNQIVEIKNTSRKNINGLLLSINDKININDIQSTAPVEIKRAKGFSGTNSKSVLNISSIPAQSLTMIFIPSATSVPDVIAMNANDLNLTVRDYKDVKNKLIETIEFTALSSLMYGIILLAFSYWLYTERKHVESELKDFKEDSDKRIDELKDNLGKNRKRLNRFTATFISRIVDYRKEISFWRNTNRAFLIAHTDASPSKIDSFFKSISNTLKTQSTLSQGADKYSYEEIEDITNELIKLKKEGL